MAGLSDLLRSGAAEDDVDVPDDASGLTGPGASDGAPGLDPDQLDPDPQPSRRSRKGRRPGRAAAGQKASKGEQDQVRDALTMLYTLPAWGLRLKDPHCGGALQDQRDDIVKALVPIVCRNPAMLAFFTAANAPWMDYLALFHALAPVGQTFWAHHVTHTVGSADSDEGGVNGVDLSAYTAPHFGP